MANVNRSAALRCTVSALAVSALLAVGALPARAQAVYGSIAGNVVDTAGAVLPGVNVTVTSVERNTTDTVVTNGSGNYAKERLLPGSYEVKAELSGFKQAVSQNVRVSVDTQTMVNLKLEVGQVSETITVTSAEGQLLKTDRADVATTFDQRQITELPILDRNFTKFILLTPGTQQQSWGHAASENPQASAQTVVNGQTFSGTGYQLDGTENRDPILGIIVINPTLDSVGESKVTSQNYEAEFGQAIAGVVSVQTKSGANTLKGSLFEFNRTDRFQARNPFTEPDVVNPLTGRVLPETKKNQFGGSLGGPIQKDKVFFFADFQGTRSSIGGSRRLTVPTALARQGNFSEYGVNIYDPAGGDPSQRQQFPGNIIPSDRISPQALAILNLLPAPTGPGIRDNHNSQGSEKLDSDQFNVRLDGRLSQNVNTFVRYSFAKYALDGPQAFGAAGGQELVSLGGVSRVKNHSVALGADYTVNSSTILDVRVGFFKYGVNVLPNDFGTTPALDAGIPGLNTGDDFTSGLPQFEINGGTNQLRFGSGLGVSRCNCPLVEQEKQFQFVTNLTKVFGNHTAKFGVDIRRAYNLRVPSDAHRSGELTFNENGTRGPNGGGIGMATFLLGNVQSFKRYVSTSTDARERQWREFFYAQDTWRATPKLTLAYGLRADIINPQTVNEPGNGGWLDLATGQALVGGVGDVNLAGNVKNKINWAPRIGIAYQIDDKTVVRLGFGRSYDIGVFGSTFGHSVTQNLPVLVIQQQNPENNFDSVFNLSQGPASPVFPAVGSNGRVTIPNLANSFALPTQQKLSHVDAYNLTVQRQLSDTVSFEVAYVGNRGEGFVGDNPERECEPADDRGIRHLNTNERRPFFNGT